MTTTPTPTVLVSPSPSALPVATTVQEPAPTLIGQLQHVDPLVWTVLAGALIVPFLQQLVKRFAKFLQDPKHRTTNYFLAGLLNLGVGYLTTLQNSGDLSRLHNPALGGLLAAGLSFLLGQNVYGFFIKTNEDLKAAKEDAALPINAAP